MKMFQPCICESCKDPLIADGTGKMACPRCMEARKRLEDSIVQHMLGIVGRRKAQNEQLSAVLRERYENEQLPAVLRERYELVSPIGSGGMGDVYEVKECETGKSYALKLLRPYAAFDKDAVRMFRREAEIMKSIRHKNVVSVHEADMSKDGLYIIMELCRGGNVASLMEKKGGRISCALATYIILQILSAMEYVEEVDFSVPIMRDPRKTMDTWGIVHRDLKAENILLSDTGDYPVAKVSDFGMAKAYRAAGFSGLTRDGTIVGTLEYMSRQQAIESKYVKPEVDVWAVAACYYYMLTGCFPRDFPREKNKLDVIKNEKPVPILERYKDIPDCETIPKSLAAVVDLALRDDPVIGYGSAGILRNDILDALSEEVRSYCKAVI